MGFQGRLPVPFGLPAAGYVSAPLFLATLGSGFLRGGVVIAHKCLRPRGMDLEVRIAGDEPRIAGIEQPAPEPVQEDLEAVSKIDEEHDMNAAPEQPREETGEFESTDLGN